jgi:homogentisate 1,2-dioxygenase
MPHYRVVGEVPRKRHMQFRDEAGALYSEELMGAAGFSSDQSLLYHRSPPTAIVSAEAVDVPDHGATTPNRPLKPRHFRTHDLQASGDLVGARMLVLANSDVSISYVAATEASELYRNAVGDECVYIESGQARFESVYGALDACAGDYIVIPSSTTHRWIPLGAEPARALIIEASGHIVAPKRYLSERGQLLEHAPYSERDLHAPTEPLIVDGEDVPVLVRHRSGVTSITYQHHPFDVVGWDGCLYPFRFSIHDYEPRVGRFHMPPPTHQTFEGPNFVVCSFCPRPFDFDREAIAVPYNHANVDSDEVLFYLGGDFMSRRGAGIGLGSITLHPSGFTHGPQPGSVEAAIGKPSTDELAVMIDTFGPLSLGPAALESEDTEYAWTWARGSSTVAGTAPQLR